MLMRFFGWLIAWIVRPCDHEWRRFYYGDRTYYRCLKCGLEMTNPENGA